MIGHNPTASGEQPKQDVAGSCRRHPTERHAVPRPKASGAMLQRHQSRSQAPLEALAGRAQPGPTPGHSARWCAAIAVAPQKACRFHLLEDIYPASGSKSTLNLARSEPAVCRCRAVAANAARYQDRPGLHPGQETAPRAAGASSAQGKRPSSECSEPQGPFSRVNRGAVARLAPSNKRSTVRLHEVPGGEDAELGEQGGDDPSDGGLSCAGIPGEDHVEGSGAQGRQAGLAPLLVHQQLSLQGPDELLHPGQPHDLVQLLQGRVLPGTWVGPGGSLAGRHKVIGLQNRYAPQLSHGLEPPAKQPRWGLGERGGGRTRLTIRVVRLSLDIVPDAWTLLVWAATAPSSSAATCLVVALPLLALLAAGSKGTGAER